MKKSNNNVWSSPEQLNNDPAFIKSLEQEFFEMPLADAMQQDETMIDTSSNRRDFLKFLGFGLGAATVAAGCQIPVKKAIPYVVRPDELVPGIANYYASAYVNGGDFVPVLVKTREGRPIKIEGNSMSSITNGGTSARAQAMVLSLYDKYRFQKPSKMGGNGNSPMEWKALDAAVMGALTATSQVRILSSTILSPSTRRAIAEFQAKFPNTKLVQYDAVSSTAMLLANEASFGKRTLPSYKFDAADVIVSFGADFLGTWISPVEYARDYAKNRKVAKELKTATMSRHYQFEAQMSMTGSNADHRTPIKPSENGAALLALYAALGGTGVTAPAINAKATKAIQAAAADLKAAGAKTLVVSNSNNTNEQIIVNAINALLGNIGTTIDFANYSNQRQGIDADVQGLFKELSAGTVDALIVMDCNPVHDLPNGKAFGEAIKKAKLSVSTAISPNETAKACQYIAPDHHILESWSDAEPKAGKYALIQPTITPLFATRQIGHSLLTWAGSSALTANAEQPYYDFVQGTWNGMMAKQSKFNKFQAFWETCLHNGVFETETAASGAAFSGNVADAASKIAAPAKGLEVVFYETIAMGAGQFANSPWLQETPDPVARTVWGNHIAIPMEWNESKQAFEGMGGLNDGESASVTVNGVTLTLPVVRQFGLAKETVAVALGHGRTEAGHGAYCVGANAFPCITVGETTIYSASKATFNAIGGKDKNFACVQMHHTMGITSAASGKTKEEKELNKDEATLGIGGYGFQGSLTDRSIIFQGGLSEIGKLAAEMKEKRTEYQELNSKGLYPDFAEKYKAGVHWGLSIDLNACTGCSACTVACMSENNVPVVGQMEVGRIHEMAWLRIDRYFYGDVENPKAVYQPMMCQHCDAAPCENVCPVNATNHSHDGLNQMTYNRCIGTRYCANNCPYKVRRFNWMDYTAADLWGWNENKLDKKHGVVEDYFSWWSGEEVYMQDNLTRMVLNPDVTVRARGVIEKCSFCVQRIQEGKLNAKRDNRNLRDTDIRTACQTACPTGAIVFGNVNDPNTAISQHREHDLVYYALEEINVKPNVAYRAKVSNTNTKLEA
jgi:MoCo/4Fe-4S cofactor protein with predicted Tat translocation signal